MITQITNREIEFMAQIERLENEAVAATLRIENDKLTIEGLTREQIGLALDAARYKWLRDSMESPIVSEGQATDKMVDAAMKGKS